MSHRVLKTAASIAAILFGATAPAHAQIFHTGDGSIQGSLCVGDDCLSAESFVNDTLRLKSNRVRLHFDDTSSTGSFPDNDWRLIANAGFEGGDEYFAIEDATAANLVFRVFAGARHNALVIDSGGDLGLGTATPDTDIHIKTGDTPTVRLEQDGTNGWQPQTWDLGGNYSNFFIRDYSAGTFPFVIRPGAPTDSITAAANGDVGLGTDTPRGPLDIETGSASSSMYFSNTNGSWKFSHNVNTGRFNIVREGGNAPFKIEPSAENNLLRLGFGASNRVEVNGDLVISGDCTEKNGACADYVFEKGYRLMPLHDVSAFIAENGHLPNIPSADEMRQNGVNMAFMSGRLLEKIEELTLYALQQEGRVLKQEKRILSQEDRIAEQKAQNLELRRRIAALEKAIIDQ